MTTQELAWKIRRHGIEMTHVSHGSHIGAILSVADIIAVLYNDIMHVNAQIPQDATRDRFILSKGHAGAAVYAALAEKGFFAIKELVTQGANGSRLSEHVSRHVPGVELSTGSLGHGLSVGCGMALAAKNDGKTYRVFIVMGDGECEEGAVWEAALFANHFKLSNLIVTIDHNHMQALDFCDKTMSLLPLADKWRAFGWNVVVVDGNNIAQLRETYQKISTDKPTCVIAHTIKGKGISFMENNILWHYRDPQGKDYEQAVKELEEAKP